MPLILVILVFSCQRGAESSSCLRIDADQDGWSPCRRSRDEQVDCDDTRADVFPGAPEACDGVDSNCDGDVGEHERDIDQDGAAACQGDCAPDDPDLNTADWDGDGWTTCEGDCDDSSIFAYPAAPEICDLMDNDCDGEVDEGLDAVRWYDDLDADGWGDPVSYVDACSRPDLSLSTRGGDCDDGDPTVHPEADEICDGLDNDCDGAVDPSCPPVGTP